MARGREQTGLFILATNNLSDHLDMEGLLTTYQSQQAVELFLFLESDSSRGRRHRLTDTVRLAIAERLGVALNRIEFADMTQDHLCLGYRCPLALGAARRGLRCLNPLAARMIPAPEPGDLVDSAQPSICSRHTLDVFPALGTGDGGTSGHNLIGGSNRVKCLKRVLNLPLAVKE